MNMVDRVAGRLVNLVMRVAIENGATTYNVQPAEIADLLREKTTLELEDVIDVVRDAVHDFKGIGTRLHRSKVEAIAARWYAENKELIAEWHLVGND